MMKELWLSALAATSIVLAAVAFGQDEDEPRYTVLPIPKAIIASNSEFSIWWTFVSSERSLGRLEHRCQASPYLRLLLVEDDTGHFIGIDALVGDATLERRHYSGDEHLNTCSTMNIHFPPHEALTYDHSVQFDSAYFSDSPLIAAWLDVDGQMFPLYPIGAAPEEFF